MNFEEIECTIRKIFTEKDEIISAYLYGSFLHSEFYKDIDIGLLISDGFKPEALYEAKIARKLEKELKNIFNIFKPVDIRVLNGKPLRFLFSVLKNSKIVYSSNDLKRVQFEARIIKEYLDFKPHYEIYDNMRRLRYANR
jgi:hypothetical protein